MTWNEKKLDNKFPINFADIETVTNDFSVCLPLLGYGEIYKTSVSPLIF